MDKALIKNSDIFPVANNGVFAVQGAVDVTVIATGNTTFKLQGSKDGGSTYADIAGSSMTSANGGTDRDAIGVHMCQVFDHLKVVLDAGQAIVVRRWKRSAPSGGTTTFTMAANTKLLIDPQLGTP